VHPRYRVPITRARGRDRGDDPRADHRLARGAIAFSSFGVLTYYAIANASAWTQRGEWRAGRAR
jgi:APA family basic amino acid/polyamine antiporter